MELPTPRLNYKVLVRCYTFNHSGFIEDTLNGLVMQQTTFPYVCLIVDDASTDGEQQVIKSFLKKECDMGKVHSYNTEPAEVMIVPHRNNRQCTMAVYLLRENHYSVSKAKTPYALPWRECSTYEALCEGDDYWIDPLKLQKQVDFLESHPDYSMCYHPVHIEENGKIISNDVRFENDTDISIEQLIKGGGDFCATCSLVCRMESVQNITNFRKIANVGDWPLQIQMGLEGKVRCLSDIMAVYRVNVPGSWTQTVMNKDFSIPFRNNIEWLLALNEETERKFEPAILKTILPFMGYLVGNKYETERELAFLLRQFSCKSVVITCGWKTFLFSYFPILYSVVKRFH